MNTKLKKHLKVCFILNIFFYANDCYLNELHQKFVYCFKGIHSPEAVYIKKGDETRGNSDKIIYPNTGEF